MPDEQSDFYVGYLPTPAAHRRFAKAAFIAVLLLAAFAGAGIAWLMDDPGEAVWQSETTTLSGTLRLDPVAFLETDEGPVLLVEVGKFGARDLTTLGDGASVAVEGLLLEREGRRMIELVAGDDAVSSTNLSVRSRSRIAASRTLIIEGEIIDTKCYLGAMKPGQGRTHAACARLCIRGGIPAGIVGTADGEPVWAVIDPREAGVISETLLNLVGETVRVQGELSGMAGLAVLRDVQLLASD